MRLPEMQEIVSKAVVHPKEEGKTITFAHVEDREEIINSPEVLLFLSAFPLDLQKACIQCFLEGDINSKKARKVKDYLLKVSDMAQIIYEEGADSFKVFEILYGLELPTNQIDHSLVNSLASLGVRRRLKAFNLQLPGIIRELHQRFSVPRIKVENLGSGPGYELLGVLQKDPGFSQWLDVRNVDKDAEAIKVGQQRFDKAGFQDQDCVKFVCQDFLRIDRRDAHLVICDGIFCATPYRKLVQFLRIFWHYLCPDGIIVYSTNQESMVESDPWTDYIMRLSGWPLDYKTDERSWQAAREAQVADKDQMTIRGYKPIRIFYEGPSTFQCMVVAQKE